MLNRTHGCHFIECNVLHLYVIWYHNCLVCHASWCNGKSVCTGKKILQTFLNVLSPKVSSDTVCSTVSRGGRLYVLETSVYVVNMHISSCTCVLLWSWWTPISLQCHSVPLIQQSHYRLISARTNYQHTGSSPGARCSQQVSGDIRSLGQMLMSVKHSSLQHRHNVLLPCPGPCAETTDPA